MDLQKLVRALLAGVYKMPDGDITAILEAEDGTEDATASTLLQKDKDRIKELTKAKPGQTFQDGYKKAKAEVLDAFELELKEKYDIDEDLKGIELVAAVIAKEAPEAGKATLTEEVIKKHPIYLRLEKEKKKEVDKVTADWTKKLEDAKKQASKTEVFGTVKNIALEKLEALNPVLPATAQVAQKQRNAWLGELAGYDWEISEDGDPVPMKDGKRAEDEHGNPVTLEEIVKTTAGTWFELKNNNGGTNAGNETDKNKDKGGKKYPAGITKPKTFEELSKIVNDKAIKLEDRNQVMEVWNAENTTK